MTQELEPLVSIIVPVYNAERYLRYCLDSILGQSHRNLDIILVDDGSDDSSPQICDEYAAADSRVSVIHQSNGGISIAQNAGLDAAVGQYIAFVDNDDILDRHNIQFLLHALETTGSDMSKARWRQFGISTIDQIAQGAREGAHSPEKVTVFTNPLHAYQTVFCKSLRIIGDLLGKKTEAKYFNEANWCRLYRRELWEGIRFPEGMYAQDVMVAGQLYSRMNRVVDIDVNLYNWLQTLSSVTHQERSFSFYRDNMSAGITNFELCIQKGIIPARSYYTISGAVADETTSTDFSGHQQDHLNDKALRNKLIRKLPLKQRAICAVLRCIRVLEKKVYDRHIKNMK